MLFYIAMCLFSVAVLLGLVIGTRRLMFKGVSKKTSVLHGVFGLAGLGVFAGYCVKSGLNQSRMVPLVLFVLAAVVGVLMYLMQSDEKPLPLSIILLHAMMAMFAFSFLLIFLN